MSDRFRVDEIRLDSSRGRRDRRLVWVRSRCSSRKKHVDERMHHDNLVRGRILLPARTGGADQVGWVRRWMDHIGLRSMMGKGPYAPKSRSIEPISTASYRMGKHPLRYCPWEIETGAARGSNDRLEWSWQHSEGCIMVFKLLDRGESGS